MSLPFVIPPIVSQLLPLLKLFGVDISDPVSIAKKLSRAIIEPEMHNEEELRHTARDLRKHNLVPPKVFGNEEATRQMIRSAMYSTWKEALPSFLKPVASKVADGIRDRLDDEVVATVAPQVTATMPVLDLVKLVVSTQLEIAYRPGAPA